MNPAHNTNEQIKPKLKHDGHITIATGKSRKETAWKNKEMLWSELVAKLSVTTRTPETFAEYKKMPKSEQGARKDIGGFVGGTLKGGRRKSDAVVWRQVITLDADFVRGDFWSAVETMLGCACAMYSTHAHSPENPRLRLVIPLTRPITPDEYPAVARRIAADLGIDFFDDTTYEPHRLMYWPSTPSDGEYIFNYLDDPWLNPDEVLARYPDWRDPSYWPESSRVQLDRKKLADKQGDPLAKPGIVGVFCRTYTIQAAIETFLGDVYGPVGDGRYTYLAGSTAGGLVVYDGDTFAYSHHGTDPVSGKLVNAFDLVRLHMFGAQDADAEPGTPTVKLPSYMVMVEFAAKDENVKLAQGQEKLAEAGMDFSAEDTEWLKQLERHYRSGKILATRKNIRLILENDPQLKGRIAKDSFANRVILRQGLPWRATDRGAYWQDGDDKALRYHLETYYDIDSQTKILDEVANVSEQSAFHPVREYLTGLVWDGLSRIDTLLIDYLGAEDSPYTRAVTRKMLVAAVARVMRPGIKFDNMLVMVGPQGVGKSYSIKLLARDWHSDSLTTVQGKEAYEQLQGAWLIEMAELSALRKAEAEAIKHFISKQEDAYRVAYGRQLSVFPRQCVFFGTTNEAAFLKDKTGNRRFWPIMVGVIERKKSLWKDMNEYEVGQIWSEALTAWEAGESLYLGHALEQEALKVQEIHTEESPLYGPIEEYLDMLLPEDWAGRGINDRRMFIQGGDFGETEAGTAPRDRVCAAEIWVELLGGDFKRFPMADRREINEVLRRMPGWRVYKGGDSKLRFGSYYGAQRAYIRVE